MILSCHQPQYLPYPGYFEKIAKSDLFVFLDEVQYKEREFQNRNRIRSGNKWIWLTVPVFSHGLGRQKIKDVLIDNEVNWCAKHLKSIKNSYAGATFFGEYSGFFEEVYAQKWEKLIDLNIHIIKFILSKLKINTKIIYESEIGTTLQKTGRIIELCKKTGADIYLSGSGGHAYIEEYKFKENGIILKYQEYKGFPGEFIPHLSIIDWLFNEGGENVRKILGA